MRRACARGTLAHLQGVEHYLELVSQGARACGELAWDHEVSEAVVAGLLVAGARRSEEHSWASEIQELAVDTHGEIHLPRCRGIGGIEVEDSVSGAPVACVHLGYILASCCFRDLGLRRWYHRAVVGALAGAPLAEVVARGVVGRSGRVGLEAELRPLFQHGREALEELCEGAGELWDDAFAVARESFAGDPVEALEDVGVRRRSGVRVGSDERRVLVVVGERMLSRGELAVVLTGELLARRAGQVGVVVERRVASELVLPGAVTEVGASVDADVCALALELCGAGNPGSSQLRAALASAQAAHAVV